MCQWLAHFYVGRTHSFMAGDEEYKQSAVASHEAGDWTNPWGEPILTEYER